MTKIEIARAWRRAPVSMFMATCAGIGHIPGGPGTYAAAVALPLIGWLGHNVGLGVHAAILTAVTLASFYWCDAAGRALEEEDSRRIVLDEFVGVWLTLLPFVNPSLLELVVGFVFFRIFDIVKPWPIRAADQKVKGGFGVMLDDLLAAFWAMPFVWLARYFFA